MVVQVSRIDEIGVRCLCSALLLYFDTRDLFVNVIRLGFPWGFRLFITTNALFMGLVRT